MHRLFEGSSFDETHETCISQGRLQWQDVSGMVDRIKKQLRKISSRSRLPKIIQVGRFLTELLKNTSERYTCATLC